MSDKIGATKIAEAVVRTVFPIPRHLCVPNVSWSLLPYEADLICVTQSGYMIEVETKISMADLKRDRDKAKWRYRQFTELVSRFYYAVPSKLADHPNFMDHVREGAGVIVVSRDPRWGLVGSTKREATKTSARPLTKGEQFKLARVASFRVWSPQQRHRLRQLKAEDEMEKKLRELRWKQRYAELTKEQAA